VNKASVLRILVLPSWYPTHASPLSGIFVRDQAWAISEAFTDVDVHVLTGTDEQEWLSLRDPRQAFKLFTQLSRSTQIETERLATRLHLHTATASQFTAAFGVDGLQLQRKRLRDVLRHIESQFGAVDVVHAHVCTPAGEVAASVCLQHDICFVLTEHQGPFPFEDLAPNGILPDRIVQVFKAADSTIAVSNSQANQILQWTGVRPLVIPNVCDEQKFFPRGDSALPPQDTFTFLAVGGLLPGKRFDVLLQAMAIVRSQAERARLMVAGDGPERDALLRQTSDLDLDSVVSWLGLVDRNRLPELFRSANAFVLSSNFESFGVVLIEAMASGLPVIATKCGGPEEIVTSEVGELVSIGDPAEMANAMLRLMTTGYSASAIRHSFISSYSRVAVSAKLREVYDSALKRRARVTGQCR
jgi:glycosyltransferase involved in cell wall biosynthesis